MSRAINVTLSVDEVQVACKKQGVTISAMETLPSGGTRVVLMSADAAAGMRTIFADCVILGVVKRYSLKTWAL